MMYRLGDVAGRQHDPRAKKFIGAYALTGL